MTDPLIPARAVHFAATLALAGAVIFGAAVAGPALCSSDAKGDGKGAVAFRITLVRIVWLAFAAAVISAAVWLVALAMQTSGHGAVEVIRDGTAWTVLRTTTIGHAMSVRLVPAALLAALLCAISPARPQPLRWTLAALLAVAFTLSLVHSGHAAATRGWFGTLHRAADGLHLVAAAAWLGGLVPLAVLLAAARRGALSLATAAVATTRFSRVGATSVATLVATGIANGVILVGSVPALIGTDYGRLLLLKVALFVAMLALAAVNRLRLTPRLLLAADASANGGHVLRPLIRNSVFEIALGLAVLALVGVLGTLSPGVQVAQAT
jgi:putative copper resistance protein D